jgi:hypothetical protein
VEKKNPSKNELSHRVFGKSLIALGKSIISVLYKINEKRKERKEKKQWIEPLIGSTEKVEGRVQVGQTDTVLEQATKTKTKTQTQAPSSTSINWQLMKVAKVVRSKQAAARAIANGAKKAMIKRVTKKADDARGELPSKLSRKTY